MEIGKALTSNVAEEMLQSLASFSNLIRHGHLSTLKSPTECNDAIVSLTGQFKAIEGLGVKIPITPWSIAAMGFYHEAIEKLETTRDELLAKNKANVDKLKPFLVTHYTDGQGYRHYFDKSGGYWYSEEHSARKYDPEIVDQLAGGAK